jgi:hypothetical protein
MPTQGFGESQQILWSHANDASARAFNVRYKQERNRYDKRYNQQQNLLSSLALRVP